MKRRTVFGLLLNLFIITGIAVAAPSPQAETGELYTVQKDDWLSNIADKYYGDMFAYPRIVEATNAKAAEDDSFAVIENPDLIEVGQKLWIPVPPEATTGSEIPEKEFEDFDTNNFDRSTNIDNKWFPLQPGTQFVYEGFTVEDGERIPHRVVFTVTDLTKAINGVRTVVIWDQDYADGELVETELAFFAQDNDGNVWHLGQYPEEYKDGEFVDAPAWIAGLEDARAGISMKAAPRLGTPSYSQGWAPAVNWTDRAQVYQMGQQTCVPFNCYEDVLVMDEFNRDEPDAFQQKYYARGVGNVRVGWRGEKEEQQETLELVDFVQLGPEALAEVRVEALELEKRAYEVSKDVYGHTPPAEHTLGAEGP